MPRQKIDRNLISQLISEGLTSKVIAERLHCSVHTVRRTRRELGLPLDNTPITAERRKRIQSMVDDGWSWKEIERTEGANYDTMRRHFPGTAWTHSHVGHMIATTRDVRPRLGTKKAA